MGCDSLCPPLKRPIEKILASSTVGGTKTTRVTGGAGKSCTGPFFTVTAAHGTIKPVWRVLEGLGAEARRLTAAGRSLAQP